MGLGSSQDQAHVFFRETVLMGVSSGSLSCSPCLGFTERQIPEDAGYPVPSPASSQFTPLSHPVSFSPQMAAILRFSSPLIPDLVLPLILQTSPPTGSILPSPLPPKSSLSSLHPPTPRPPLLRDRKERQSHCAGQWADSPIWRKVRVGVRGKSAELALGGQSCFPQ